MRHLGSVAFYETFTKLTNSIPRPNAPESLAPLRPESRGKVVDVSILKRTHASGMNFPFGQSTAMRRADDYGKLRFK